jgi:hypothetical protein
MFSWLRRPSEATKWALVLGGALSLSALNVGCKKEPKELITLQVGPLETIRFEVVSGFAHYYELPGKDDELRILVSSYPMSCQSYTAPPPGETLISITVKRPTPETITTGEYPWEGLHAPSSEESPRDDATKSKASALPFVRLAEDARALPPGGGLKLTQFEPEPFGLVAGEFAFRDAGPGQVATTALLGKFSVRMCHLQIDSSRRAQEAPK